MSLANVRDNMKTRLETISGLNVHEEVPDSIPKLPAAVTHVVTGDYQKTLSGMVEWELKVYLFIAERDSSTAWAELEDYMEATGAKSIKAAVEGGTVADGAMVARVENAGHMVYRGRTFIGAEFAIRVMDTT